LQGGADLSIGVAVVGIGYWGSRLLRVFMGLEGCRVLAICESDQTKAAKLRTQYPHVQVETEFEVVVSMPDVEAVIIALPSIKHYEFGTRVLSAGKHCFIEKPITNSSHEAMQLIELAKKSGRHLMVGHTFEYHPAVRWVDDYIKRGDLGDVLHIFSQRMNLGIVRTDVDALWNLAPHDISMIFHWLDAEAPLQVSCRSHSFLKHERDLADMAWLTMEFSSGTVAQVQVSWLSPEKIRQTMIVGSKRMIIFDDVSLDSKIRVFDKRVDLRERLNESVGYGESQMIVRSGDVITPNLPNLEPLGEEARHFIECVRSGEPPLTDGENGQRVVKVLEHADDSCAANGIPILFR